MATTSRCRTSGAATGWCRTAWSSGRAVRTVSTTGCGTCSMPTRGAWSGCPHDPTPMTLPQAPDAREEPGRGVAARFRRVALDITPLRLSPPFRRLLIGDAVSVIGTQVTAVAVPIQVYEQTHSGAAVGLVGLAGLLPLIVFGLYGGAIADAMDRRQLVIFTTLGQTALSAVLFAQAVVGLHSTALLYAVVAVQAALFSMDSPARSAFTPRLLPVHLLPAANALKQVEFNIGVTVGPLLAGLIVAGPGYATAYALDALSFGASMWAVLSLPAMPPAGGGRRAGTASVLEGLAF